MTIPMLDHTKANDEWRVVLFDCFSWCVFLLGEPSLLRGVLALFSVHFWIHVAPRQARVQVNIRVEHPHNQ